MWRELTAAAASLFIATVFIIQDPGPPEYIQKVIAKHGTYLDEAKPMLCGTGDMDDDALHRIKDLFQKVAGWPNFRGAHTMGIWETSISGCHVPAAWEQCEVLLKQSGVKFKKAPPAEGIADPVELGKKMNGIELDCEEPLIVDCNLAAAMVKMTKLLAKKKVKAMGIMSAHRPESQYSFHSLGLALDINWFKSSEWNMRVYVQTNFEKRTKYKTCSYTPQEERGVFLMDIACTLWEEKVFNTILTPNYNPGHYNHYHLDLRPGDNRFYLN